MNKVLIALGSILIAMSSIGNSIFITSGGDFRKSSSYWKVVTESDNQTIQVTPTMELNTSKDVSNVSIKIDNQAEYAVGSEQLPLTSGKTTPISFTFPKAGTHIVKMYDNEGIVNRIYFTSATQSNPDTSLVEFKYIQSGYVITEKTCQYYNSLVNVTIPEGVPGLGGLSFSYCQSLKKVVLPNSIKAIGSQCFRDCLNLEEINIPEGTTQLNSYVLYYSGLKSIVCPSSLTRVTGRSISMMPKLTTITFLNKDIDISSNGSNGGFEQCNYVSVIYYAGTIDDWNANESLSSRFGTARDLGTGSGFIDYNGSNGRNKQLYYNYHQ